MKAHQLPEEHKYYIVMLSNKAQHKITGITKKNILTSKTNFVELSNGNVINKAFIVEIVYSSQQTQIEFSCLPEEKQRSLVQQRKVNTLESNHGYLE